MMHFVEEYSSTKTRLHKGIGIVVFNVPLDTL